MLTSHLPQYIPHEQCLTRLTNPKRLRPYDVTPAMCFIDGGNVFLQNAVTDLYAFGIIMLELHQMKVIDSDGLPEKKKKGEGLPEMPADVDPAYLRIMTACLGINPDFKDTPLTAQKVFEMLNELHRSMAAKGAISRGGAPLSSPLALGAVAPKFNLFSAAPAAPAAANVYGGAAVLEAQTNGTAAASVTTASAAPSGVAVADFTRLDSDARLIRLKQLFQTMRKADEFGELVSRFTLLGYNPDDSSMDEVGRKHLEEQLRLVLNDKDSEILLDGEVLASLLMLYEQIPIDLLAELLNKLMRLCRNPHATGCEDMTQRIFLLTTILADNRPATPTNQHLRLWIEGFDAIMWVIKRAETEFSAASQAINEAIQTELFVRLQDGYALFAKEGTFLAAAGRLILMMDEMTGDAPEKMKKHGILRLLLESFSQSLATSQLLPLMDIFKAIQRIFNASQVVSVQPQMLKSFMQVIRMCCEVGPSISVNSATSGVGGANSSSTPLQFSFGAAQGVMEYRSIPDVRVKDNMEDLLARTVQTIYFLCKNEGDKLSGLFPFFADCIDSESVGMLLGIVRGHIRVESFDMLEGAVSVLAYLTHPDCHAEGLYLSYFSQFQDSFHVVLKTAESFKDTTELATELQTGVVSINKAMASLRRLYVASNSLARENEEKERTELEQKLSKTESDEEDRLIDEALDMAEKTAAQLQRSCAGVVANACGNRAFQDSLVQSRATELMCRAVELFHDDEPTVVECLLALSRVCHAHNKHQEYIFQNRFLNNVVWLAYDEHKVRATATRTGRRSSSLVSVAHWLCLCCVPFVML